MAVYDSNTGSASKIFISYSSIDRIRTNGLGLLLEALGHRVFHDHRTIKPGMRWRAALQEGLDEADVLMVFWTKHAARSDWVKKEYEHFYTSHPERPLVPVLGDETPVPELLKTRQQADFAPLVNEVLELKRRMKKDGAGAGEIERAVHARLEDAGVEVKTKKQKRMIFLFLGFGWLLTLLREPAAALARLGRGFVEKGAQLTAGQAAAIAMAAVVGLAAGVPVADNLPWRPAAERSASAEGGGPGEEGGGRTGGVLPDIDLAQPEWYTSMGDSLADFRAGFLESQLEINRRLVGISRRLDELDLVVTDSLSICRRENLELRGGIAQLQGALAESRAALASGREPRREVEPAPVTPLEAELVTPSGQRLELAPLEAGGVIANPEVISAPPPEYPEMARQRQIEGVVNVWATIGRDGTVAVDSLTGPGVLADGARRAIERWTFRPGMRDGVPVERHFMVKVDFVLRG